MFEVSASIDVSPNVAARAVVVEIHVERAVDVAPSSPDIGREDAFAAEDPKHVGLGDRTGDVIVAAVVVFGDGDFRAGIEVVDVALHARQQLDRPVRCPGCRSSVPHWLIHLFGVGRIPQRARRLDAGCNGGCVAISPVMRMPSAYTSGYQCRSSTSISLRPWAISALRTCCNSHSL